MLQYRIDLKFKDHFKGGEILYEAWKRATIDRQRPQKIVVMNLGLWDSMQVQNLRQANINFVTGVTGGKLDKSEILVFVSHDVGSDDVYFYDDFYMGEAYKAMPLDGLKDAIYYAEVEIFRQRPSAILMSWQHWRALQDDFMSSMTYPENIPIELGNFRLHGVQIIPVHMQENKFNTYIVL